MKAPISSYLDTILDEVRYKDAGANADYIPELADKNPNALGAAMCTTSGHIYSAGDAEVEFSIQSISKPFVYAMAVQEHGIDVVSEIVGMEPSGEAFNELSLDREGHRPVNPMINAGAIAVTQLIGGTEATVEDRIEMIRSFLSEMACRQLRVDYDLCESELKFADRNLSLAHMLRNYDIIQDDAHDAVVSYTAQCSIIVNTRDLAFMSAVLANGGKHPLNGKRVLEPDVCRLTLAVMSSAGMYDQAGRWMAHVGIPAKSGVSGGLLGTLPGQLGFASYSPRLNEYGNSVRGVRIFKLLSQDMGLHLMAADDRAGVDAVRSIVTYQEDTVVTLQGMINFNSAESILYELSQHEISGDHVIFDMTRVSSIRKMGRYLLKEGMHLLEEKGFRISIVDPDDHVPDYRRVDGTEIHVNEQESAPFATEREDDRYHDDDCPDPDQPQRPDNWEDWADSADDPSTGDSSAETESAASKEPADVN